MIKCSCGKPISTVPDWLQGVKVNFVCNNCPNRDVLGITQVDFFTAKPEEAPQPDKMEPEAPEEEFELEDEAEVEA